MPPKEDLQWLEQFLERVREGTRDSAQRAIEYLTLANGGGVIACLTLIASSSPRSESAMVVALLVLFLLGLAFVGLAVLHDHYYGLRFYLGLMERAGAFRAGGMTATDFQAYLYSAKPKQRMEFNRRLAAASFCLFWIAALSACIWLVIERVPVKLLGS